MLVSLLKTIEESCKRLYNTTVFVILLFNKKGENMGRKGNTKKTTPRGSEEESKERIRNEEEKQGRRERRPKPCGKSNGKIGH